MKEMVRLLLIICMISIVEGFFIPQRSIFRPVNRKFASTGKIFTDIHLMQFDGGSRGNPGAGGSGVVIYKVKEISETYLDATDLVEIWYGCFYLGATGITNNVAEYLGLIHGLKQCLQMKINHLIVEGDSQLVIRQVEGLYKIKNPELLKLHTEAVELSKGFEKIHFLYVPRAFNSRADELANMALDLRRDECCALE